MKEETTDEYFARVFNIRPKPPLDDEQLRLLEMGFPVKPSYDPRFYKDSKMDPKYVDWVIEQVNKKQPA